MDIIFSKQQLDAMDAIIAWFQNVHGNNSASQQEREFYMAGYAGVGKTLLAKEITDKLIEMFNIHNVISGAYTGKACDVLRNKGMKNVMTIHSMMYIPKKDKATGLVKFEISPFAPVGTADLIVLDEVSMCDDKLTRDLRSFNKPILIIGDPAQLPPINGVGGFVANRKPDYFLDEIHRQVADSPILKLATMARNGDKIPVGVYGDNVMVTDKFDQETLNDYVLKKGTQPICGMNKTRRLINRTFRKRLGFGDYPYPQAGEKLICCQNDVEQGLFNGITGIAFAPTQNNVTHQRKCDVYFKSNSDTLNVKGNFRTWKAIFEQNYHESMKEPEFKKGTQKFDWGFCLTVHKSQGSEWDTVTVIDESYIFGDNANKWLYTALTRASKRLIVIQT